MPELEKIVWPGNPAGGMMGMGGMYGMGMITDQSPSKSFSEEELANIRAIATLLLENGLTSAKLKTAADIADLTKEKLDAEREEADEFSTVDSDYDGFYDYEEELTGHDPERSRQQADTGGSGCSRSSGTVMNQHLEHFCRRTACFSVLQQKPPCWSIDQSTLSRGQSTW